METNAHRLKYLIANWKMNLSISESVELSRVILSIQNRTNSLLKIGLTPSFSALSDVHKIIAGSNILLGIQNCATNRSGSFTGEESVNLLNELDIHYVLVGHSERRYLFKESYQQIAKKIALVNEESKLAILCIGETAKIKRQSKERQYIARQIQSALSQSLNPAKLIIAYEPVWAISSQKSHYQSELVNVSKMCAFIRKLLEARFGSIAIRIPVLYGGSVTALNFKNYWQIPELDGVLIGQASTLKDSIIKIIELGT